MYNINYNDGSYLAVAFLVLEILLFEFPLPHNFVVKQRITWFAVCFKKCQNLPKSPPWIELKLPEMKNSVQSRAKIHTFSRLTRGGSEIAFLGLFLDLEPGLSIICSFHSDPTRAGDVTRIPCMMQCLPDRQKRGEACRAITGTAMKRQNSLKITN
jgi:hypothetical protein